MTDRQSAGVCVYACVPYIVVALQIKTMNIPVGLKTMRVGGTRQNIADRAIYSHTYSSLGEMLFISYFEEVVGIRCISAIFGWQILLNLRA